jgi:hypothetical protein
MGSILRIGAFSSEGHQFAFRKCDELESRAASDVKESEAL